METMLFGALNKAQASNLLIKIGRYDYFYKLEMKKHRFNFDFRTMRDFYYSTISEVIDTMQYVCEHMNVLVTIKVYTRNYKNYKYKCIQRIQFYYNNK